MAANGGGRILNVASLAGFLPGPQMAVYHASKAYLLPLSEAVAEEAARDAVFVTALCPGVTKTGFFAADGAESAHPLNRFVPLASAEAVAAAGWRTMERNRRVVVPGVLNKAFSFGPRVLLRRVMAFVTGILLKRRG